MTPLSLMSLSLIVRGFLAITDRFAQLERKITENKLLLELMFSSMAKVLYLPSGRFLK